MRSLIFLCLLFVAKLSYSVAPPPDSFAPELKSNSYALMDYTTGNIILSKNINQKIDPASITKIMTSYAIYSSIYNKIITINDKVKISKKSWGMTGSKMFLNVGKSEKLETLLKGLVVQSGNDAAVALAEHISGTEQKFVDYMNKLAQHLKMTNTHYQNATGMPHKNHKTTVADTLKLSKALIRDFPQYYKMYKVKEFTYNNIRQYNRNGLLWQDDKVDGIKTGHTKDAGFCLVASALKNNMRLISVVMGTKSDLERTRQSKKLLDYGFYNYMSYAVFKASQNISNIKVYEGEIDTLQLTVSNTVNVNIKKKDIKSLKAQIKIPKSIIAPIKKYQKVGTLVINLGGKIIARYPLVAKQDIPQSGFFSRMIDKAYQYFEE
ncbi:MAG: serine-type D-Ala-D-Ala carboxypeptidase [Gammaproteobacteria bacterium]|nr:MAG: serine-type D-Ala-D-Ala carboxypeptidase [Gammaproteobacteria bacterium]